MTPVGRRDIRRMRLDLERGVFGSPAVTGGNTSDAAAQRRAVPEQVKVVERHSPG
jgi:hypothetical protein